MILPIRFPEEISGVYNPVCAHIYSTADMVLLRLEVESELYLDDFQEVALLEQTPDEIGHFYFYLERSLEAVLRHEVPTETAQFFRSKRQCLRYKISLAQLISLESAENPTFTEYGTYFAFLGGYEFLKYPNRTAPLPWDANFLLRHKPVVRHISTTQEEWLLLMPEEETNYTIPATVHYTDETSAVVEIAVGTVRKYEPCFVRVGMNPSYEALNKTVHSVQVLGITLHFYDTAGWADTHEFHYFTRAGAFEAVLCRGLHVEQIQDEGLDFRHFYDYFYKPTERVIREYNQERTSGGEVRTGYFHSLDEFKAVSELFRRLPCTKRQEGVYLPVRVSTDKHERQRNFEPLQGYTFTYTFAHVE